MERILIARLSAMGDIVHSLPAVAALRQAFPEAKIGWIIDERWVELLAARSAIASPQRSAEKPLVDAIHTFDVRSWRKNPFSASSRANSRNLLAQLRAQKYETAIDLQAAIRSALLNWLSRAPERVGFAKPRELPAKMFYTRSVETPAVHVVEQGLQLANAISGGSQGKAEFPLPCDAEAARWRDKLLAGLGAARFVILAPGAGWGAKCWPAERYGEVARALSKDGFKILINAGPGEEVLAQEVAGASQSAAQVISSSLSQLLALIRRASLFVGGDTGPLHLAAACGVRVLAIYGPTNPARNGPYAPGGDASRIAVLRSAESQTTHARHSQPEAGLLQISAEQVVTAARKLLGMPA
jgi:heptosyltransferase-1